MKVLTVSAVLFLASCTSKPSRLFKQLPADAGELFGMICSHVDGGLSKPDEDLKTAKLALLEKTLIPGLEAVRCVPSQGLDAHLTSLVFDHETRRLFGVSAIVTYGDLQLLDKLVLPTLSESERAGYEFVKMRQAAPWMNIQAENWWWDGHAVIWMAWTDADYRAWPPTPATKLEVQIMKRK